MATRRKVERAVDFADAADESEEEEVEIEDEKPEKKGKKGKKGTEETKVVMKKKPAGLNYAAICFLLMMILPAMITLGIQAYDMMYPKLAAARLVREKIQKCYDQAKPNDKVDIDAIVKKYKGKENSLFANLRNKYAKFPACH